jgi:hypothetical protein
MSFRTSAHFYDLDVRVELTDDLANPIDNRSTQAYGIDLYSVCTNLPAKSHQLAGRLHRVYSIELHAVEEIHTLASDEYGRILPEAGDVGSYHHLALSWRLELRCSLYAIEGDDRVI